MCMIQREGGRKQGPGLLLYMLACFFLLGRLGDYCVERRFISGVVACAQPAYATLSRCSSSPALVFIPNDLVRGIERDGGAVNGCSMAMVAIKLWCWT